MIASNADQNTRFKAIGYFLAARVCQMGVPKEEAMLIKYSCRDMGLPCSFMVKGATVEEVTQKALEHVQEKHAEDFNRLLTPEEIEVMRIALARSTRVVPG